MVTGWEIVDTAVKIGLGALISGAGAILLARLNHNREKEKELDKRRRDALERIAEMIQAFDDAFNREFSAFAIAKEIQETGGRYNPKVKEKLLASVEALSNSFREVIAAEGRLLLLGEIAAQKAVHEYSAYINAFLKDQKNKEISFADLATYAKRSQELKASMYEKLNEAYMK